MSKIAICFSGQIRTGILTHPNVISYFDGLMDNADIFVHCWNIRTSITQTMQDPEHFILEDEKLFSRFKDLYSPKMMRVDQYDKYAPYLQPHPQFHSINTCNELRKDYENKTGVSYDLVIRIRPDLLFNPEHKLIQDIQKIIELNSENVIYVNDNFDVISVKTDDIFWIASPSIMDIVADFANNWKNVDADYYKDFQILLKEYLSFNNIECEKFPYNNSFLIYRHSHVNKGVTVKMIENDFNSYRFNIEL